MYFVSGPRLSTKCSSDFVPAMVIICRYPCGAGNSATCPGNQPVRTGRRQRIDAGLCQLAKIANLGARNNTAALANYRIRRGRYAILGYQTLSALRICVVFLDIRRMTDPLGRDCTPRRASARAGCGHERLQTPEAGRKGMARAGKSEMASIKTHLLHGSCPTSSSGPLMPARDRAAAADRRSAAGSRRTASSARRPRPSGRRHIGRESPLSRRS